MHPSPSVIPVTSAATNATAKEDRSMKDEDRETFERKGRHHSSFFWANSSSIMTGRCFYAMSHEEIAEIAAEAALKTIRDYYAPKPIKVQMLSFRLVRGICGSLIRPNGNEDLRSCTDCRPDLTNGRYMDKLPKRMRPL
jgi:hypothetical protein